MNVWGEKCGFGIRTKERECLHKEPKYHTETIPDINPNGNPHAGTWWGQATVSKEKPESEWEEENFCFECDENCPHDTCRGTCYKEPIPCQNGDLADPQEKCEGKGNDTWF